MSTQPQLRRHPLWPLAAVTMLATGCSDYFLQPDYIHPATYGSDALVVRPNPQVALCSGTIEHLEAFIPALLARTAPGITLSEPVTYQVLQPDELHGELRCADPRAFACARGGVVFTRDGLDLHETTHAVRQLAYGWSTPGPLVLEEGLATLFTEQRVGNPSGRLTEQELEVVARDDPFTEALYPPSAHFLSFLHHDLDPAAVHRFVSESGEVESFGDYAAPFAGATGASWAEAWTAYQREPVCETWAIAQRIVECERPADITLGDGEPHRIVIDDFGCQHPAAVGPIAGQAWGKRSGDDLWRAGGRFGRLDAWQPTPRPKSARRSSPAIVAAA